MTTSKKASERLLGMLNGPPPSTCKAEQIDFEKVGIPGYKNCFAVLIEDLLSAEECKELITGAQEAHDNRWEQALVNVGMGQQKLITDARLCERILWDEKALADKLLHRVMPHLPENVVTLKDSTHISGIGPVKRKETWKISRLNERCRFLKYTSGMYFREHCDGSYVTPDGTERTLITVHFYLNGSDIGVAGEGKLEGGATRFFPPGGSLSNQHFDVNPKTGACLVFQHRNLMHSGEDVIAGTKYTLRSDILYRKVEEQE